jgi:hypothetical protein
MSSLNTQGILYGADGVNEIFDISSSNNDGSKKSGWSGMIVGGRGRKIYRIHPKDPTQETNKIIIKDFDISQDIIDLSLYPTLLSIASLTYQTVPLTIILPDNQLIVIPSRNGMDLEDTNFIFQSSTISYSSSSSSFNFAALMKHLDTYMVLGICLFVPMLVMVAIFYFTRKDKIKSKKISRLPPLGPSVSHGSDPPKDNLSGILGFRLDPIASESQSKDDDEDEEEDEEDEEEPLEELDIGFNRRDSTDSNSTQGEEVNFSPRVDEVEDNEESFDENFSYDFESFSSSMRDDVFDYHPSERVGENDVGGYAVEEENLDEGDEEQDPNSPTFFIITWE